jgi:hypothetical protein
LSFHAGLRLLDTSIDGPPEQQEFRLRILLVNTLLDYPGYVMATQQLGPGALQGCVKCPESGIWIPVLNKTIYDEHVRRNLPLDHPLRTDPAFKTEELRGPQKRRTHAQLEQDANIVMTMPAGKAKKAFIKSTGVKGRSSLFDIPYFDMAWRPIVDPMHCLANVADRFINVVTGESDTRACRQDMQNEAFQNSTDWIRIQPIDSGKRKKGKGERGGKRKAERGDLEEEEYEEVFPPVDWVLNKDEMVVWQRRLQVRVPTFFGTSPAAVLAPGMYFSLTPF